MSNKVYKDDIFNPTTMLPYSAFHLDISTKEIYSNFTTFINKPDKNKLEQEIEKILIKKPSEENILFGSCVRSLFDLILQVYNFEPGSEIVMTGINIPDMVKIIYHHGLKPVPINVYVEDLAPKVEDLRKAITPKTKALLLSYYFGCDYDATEIYKVAKEYNLLIIEDAAEAFYDVNWNGNPLADATFFSFGTIKTMSAMGSAIGIIRKNQVLYRKMKHILMQYPEVTLKFFGNRLAKNLIVYNALNNKTGNLMFKDVANKLKVDYREKCISLVRGFPVSEDNFLNTYRIRPNAPMIALLHHRFKTYDRQDIIDSTQKQIDAQDQLVKAGIIVPGHKIRQRHFWLYPIVVPDPQLCQRLLVTQGIDAYLGATQLKVVQPPIGHYRDIDQTVEYFEKLIYLPIHKAVPRDAIQKIVREAIGVINFVKKQQAQQKSAKL